MEFNTEELKQIERALQIAAEADYYRLYPKQKPYTRLPDDYDPDKSLTTFLDLRDRVHKVLRDV